MSMSHTINVSDLSDHDAVLRILSEIQHNGTSYSLVQDGVEVAKVVPGETKKTTDPDDLMRKRQEVFAKVDALSKKIAQAWCTDETAVEAITNDRDASERRLTHGGH